MRGERHARGARSAGSKKGGVGWRNMRHSAECRLHKVNRNTRLEITYLMTETPSANPMDGIYNHPGNSLHPLRVTRVMDLLLLVTTTDAILFASWTMDRVHGDRSARICASANVYTMVLGGIPFLWRLSRMNHTSSLWYSALKQLGFMGRLE